jgi:hypothetical protein
MRKAEVDPAGYVFLQIWAAMFSFILSMALSDKGK